MKTIYYKLRALLVGWLLRRLPRTAPLVFQGPDSARALAEQIAVLGFRRVLLVSDEHLADAGVLEGIQSTLADRRVEAVPFFDVSPDPGFTQVLAGEAKYRDKHCDAVLGVGGGSVLDVAKMIALLHENPGKLSDFDGVQKSRHPRLPLFLAPTTAGTGSEISLAAVITDDASQRKIPVIDSKLVPDYIALDARLMLGMPRDITAASGMDALTHAVEAYLSRAATPNTERQSLAALDLIFTYLPRAWDEGGDLEARGAMATAAFYAGAAFSHASLGYVHGIAHQLGRVCHLPHGVANALVLPGVLTAYGPSAYARLAEMARAVGLVQAEGDDAILAQRFVAEISRLRAQLQLPGQVETLREEDVAGIVKAALWETGNLYPVPRYLSAAEVTALVRQLIPDVAIN